MKHKVLRIGAYARVSHEEQKKYGYSVNAQIERLSNWCKENNCQLVDIFIDEGYTAGNMKRPKLKEMFDRLNELDVIIFTRLDRLSRNVLDANSMLATLNKNNVGLISIDEDDIDTTTADGLFMFNLKVNLAERELRKGSERIRDVFDYKIKAGQPISGSLPLGYKIANIDGFKKVVIDDETAHIVKAIFEHFGKYHSIRSTMDHINNNYNIDRGYIAYNRILKNPLYTGMYKGNENYCPAYITHKQYMINQDLIKANIKKRKTNNIFLFTSLMKCPKCGGKMVGRKTHEKRYNRIYYNYRCSRTYVQKKCDMNIGISESLVIEPYLLNNIDRLIDDHIIKVTSIKPLKQNNIEKRIKNIRDEMEKLNYMYLKKRIKTNDYDREYEKLEKELKQLERNTPKTADISHLRDFLNSDWRNIYHSLNRENKRALWRNMIKEIVIDVNLNIVDVIFI